MKANLHMHDTLSFLAFSRLIQNTGYARMRFARLSLLVTCLLMGQPGICESDVSIRLAHDSSREAKIRVQLTQLLGAYDTSRWTFTREVLVDEEAIPHSHPVLTLHTRHGKDDDLLLSTYVHEQLHWFVSAHPAETKAAVVRLKKMYPRIPVGYPEGSNDEAGNYEHLIVCYLEYKADQALMGELKAREVLDFWAHDHYTWLYREVLAHPDKVGAVVKEAGLVPRS
jgi:hypothetical protein